MFERLDWSWRDPIILNMRRHNDPAHLIARVIKVNKDSLRKRERVLGLKPRKVITRYPNRADVWTRAERQTLRRMWLDNQSVLDIVAKLPGRTKKSVWTMRINLGLPARYVRCDRQLSFPVSAELHEWACREAVLAKLSRSRFLEGYFSDLMANYVADEFSVSPERYRKQRWTDEERDTLRRLWLRGDPIAAILKFLPHRTVSAIMYEREKMGLEARNSRRRTRYQLTMGIKNDLDRWLGRESTRLGLQRHQFMQRLMSQTIDQQRVEAVDFVCECLQNTMAMEEFDCDVSPNTG